MNFHNIVRRWCKAYKPMCDHSTNGNRRFYLTDTTAGVVELAKGIANTMSPCVVMESSVEGFVEGGFTYRDYPIYFFVRARDMADGDAAAEAKEEAWYHCQNFLTWLRTMHDNDPTRTREFDRIDLENSITIQTVGPIENGWFAVLLQLTRQEPLNLCVEEELYVEEPWTCV